VLLVRDLFTIDGMMFLIPAVVFSVLVAYQAMKFTAMKRYHREDAEKRAEQERKRQEKKAAQ
jgi:hypothetical protein